MIGWQRSYALLRETNRKYFHLKRLLNWESVRVHKTDCLFEIFPGLEAAQSVNMICHPSHCIKARVNNAGWLGRPPACTQEVQSSPVSTICFARMYSTPGTQSLSHALKGVHPSMDTNNTEIFIPMYACKKDKLATRQVDRYAQKCIRAQIWRLQTNTQKHVQVLHTLFLSLSGRVDLQLLAGERSHS